MSPDRDNVKYVKHIRQPSTKTKDDLDKILDELVQNLNMDRLKFPITIVYTDLDCIEYCFEYMSASMGPSQYECKASPENRLFAQYHRFYPDKMKSIIIKNLCSEKSKIRLVFATIALGMGLNAPNIRRIIHFKPPTSIEKYIQETGRAGRDGASAEAILYYNKTDVRSNRPGIRPEIIKYCNSKDKCLRSIILQCMGHTSSATRDLQQCCSYCSSLHVPSELAIKLSSTLHL